jgi:hypothetical protein
MLLFGLAGAVALVGYWPRTFTWPPDPNAMRAFVTTDECEIKLIVLDEMVAAYRANELALGRKFLLFGWSIAIAAIATGLLGASVIIELLQVTRAYT